jgi:hypothetical protein
MGRVAALLVLVVVMATFPDAMEAVNPGVKLRISQVGLNYGKKRACIIIGVSSILYLNEAAQQALSSLAAQVQGKTIDDQSGKAHTAIGKVKYELTQ